MPATIKLGRRVFRKAIIRWTTDEWKDLAVRVHRARARHPTESIFQLVNRVQNDQNHPWPEDRKRTVNTLSQVKPIVPLLRDIDLDLREQTDRLIPSLQDQVATLRDRPSREQIIETMPDEEVLRRFTVKIFAQYSPAEIINRFSADDILASIPLEAIYAYLGKAIFTSIADLRSQLATHINEQEAAARAAASSNGQHKNGHVNGHHVPRIAIVGAQQHQFSVIAAQIGSRAVLRLVKKGEDCQVQDVDRCVIMETFTPATQRNLVRQQLPSDRIISHRGTVDELISTVKGLVSRKPK